MMQADETCSCFQKRRPDETADSGVNYESVTIRALPVSKRTAAECTASELQSIFPSRITTLYSFHTRRARILFIGENYVGLNESCKEMLYFICLFMERRDQL